MRYIKIMLLIIFSYILQGSVLSHSKFFGIVPNLIAVCLICFSLYEDDWFGVAVLGAICGLFLDTGGIAVMGLNTILCMYTAIFCSIISKKFFRGKFIVSIMFVFIVSIIYETLMYIFGFELWRDGRILYCIFHVILPASFYNALVAAALYFPIRRISNAAE